MCDFCILFDFSSVRAKVEQGVATIERAPTDIPFIPKQQFNFCPMCGRPLVQEARSNAFPQNLRRIRRLRGVTQEAIARELGLQKCAVSKWEKGRTVPNAKQLTTLCKLLNVSPQELL